jgi:hypothetical protein
MTHLELISRIYFSYSSWPEVCIQIKTSMITSMSTSMRVSYLALSVSSGVSWRIVLGQG